jgi:cytochrome b involved in lipid metabolism
MRNDENGNKKKTATTTTTEKENSTNSERVLMIIDGFVYDVSRFQHPGGEDVLKRYNGKDATDGFMNERAHGKRAREILEKYLVGRILEEEANVDGLNDKNVLSARKSDYNNNTKSDTAAAAMMAVTRVSNYSSSEEDLGAFIHNENVRSTTNTIINNTTIINTNNNRLSSDGDASETNEEDTININTPINDNDNNNNNTVDEYGIDYDKPLLQQVPGLKDKYFEWTHIPEPSRKDGTQQRFFEADWMEALSVTAWFVVPLIWVPVIVYCIYFGITESSLLTAAANTEKEDRDDYNFMRLFMTKQLIFFLFGIFSWGFKEYTMHRFLFHKEPPGDSKFFITIHFLFHGCHHKHPMDALRLVFPPVLAIPIAFGFYTIYGLLFGKALAKLVIAGSLTGYVSYDLTHYACHHLSSSTSETSHKKKTNNNNNNNNNNSSMFNRYARRVKRRHMMHHYETPNAIFGISQSTWDCVFRTTACVLDKQKAG